MKKNVVLLGCSNLLGMHHAFRQVFQHTQSDAHETETCLEDDYAKYTNLAVAGAGNSLIKWRLFDLLEHELPDYVYLQFSGLIRQDFYFDKASIENFDQSEITTSKKHLYIRGGNYVHEKNAKSFVHILKNLSYNFYDDNLNNWHSLQDIFSAVSVLEKLEIKHNWSIYYDPINPPTENTKMEGMIAKWPAFIDFSNKLSSPLNYAIDSGIDVLDGVHFGYDAFSKYLENNKSKIHLNFDDK